MANNKITLTVNTKEVDRLCIGGMIYDALDYGNADNVYGVSERDESGNTTVTLSKDDIIKLIKLVNKNNMFKDIIKVEID
jgi:hypothetical protein